MKSLKYIKWKGTKGCTYLHMKNNFGETFELTHWGGIRQIKWVKKLEQLTYIHIHFLENIFFREAKNFLKKPFEIFVWTKKFE